jgi:hypothetical protein
VKNSGEGPGAGPERSTTMPTERIDVIAYSGRTGNERPAAFVLRGLRVDVLEIRESWIEEEAENRARKRHFRLKGSDGNSHRIYFDEEEREWHYVSRRRLELR